MVAVLLFLQSVGKSLASMKDAEIVDILDITSLEVKKNSVLFREEMQSIQSFCLCFAQGRDVGRSR